MTPTTLLSQLDTSEFVNTLQSAGFANFPELTVIPHQTVGGFYSAAATRIGLTSVLGLRARVNPAGTGIASCFIGLATVVGAFLSQAAIGGMRLERIPSLARYMEDSMGIGFLRNCLGTAAILLASAGTVQAGPTFDSFGSLPSATFGGSGIPNDMVAISYGTFGSQDVTLGLSAHQRYGNPALTGIGGGNYYATQGANYGDPLNPTTPSPSTVLGTTWDFGLHVEVASGTIRDLVGSLGMPNVTLSLRYDADPGPGTDFGTIDLGALLLALEASGTTAEMALATAVLNDTKISDSQNLLFSFLYTDVAGIIASPIATSIDPYASGVYSFELEATAGSTTALSAIDVHVVPEPGTLALFGLGLAGLAVVRRRKSTL